MIVIDFAASAAKCNTKCKKENWKEQKRLTIQEWAQEVREQQNLVDIAHHDSHIGEDGDRDAVPFDDAHGASVSVLVFGLRGGPIRGLSAAARAAAESIRVSPLCGRAAGSPLPVCYILSGTPMPSRRIDAESVRATVAASVRRSACLAGSLSRITGKSW